MFRKMLSDGNIKHFKYAPPTTGLDDISDDRLPERLSRLTEAFAQLDARHETPDYLMLDGDSLQQVVFRARQVASLETPVPQKN